MEIFHMLFLSRKRIGVVTFLFVFSFHTAAAAADPLPLASGEWVPFTSKKMENYGKFTGRVAVVLKQMGIEPEYRFYPWQRCFDAVIKGRVWAAFPYSYTENRARQVWFSDPLSCSKTLFFYYKKNGDKGSYPIKSAKDLRSYKLGGVRGYYYQEFFEKTGLDVDYVNKEIYAFEKLILGRIHLMPVNELVGWHLIETHFKRQRHQFNTLSLPLSVNPLCLIVSKDYPGSKKMLERFNQALAACVKKGLLTIEPCEPEIGLMK